MSLSALYQKGLTDQLVPLAEDTNAKWLDRKYVSWDNLVQPEEAEEEFTENFDGIQKLELVMSKREELLQNAA